MGLAPLKSLRVNRRTYWVGLGIACGLELAAEYLLYGVYQNAFSATWRNCRSKFGALRSDRDCTLLGATRRMPRQAIDCIGNSNFHGCQRGFFLIPARFFVRQGWMALWLCDVILQRPQSSDPYRSDPDTLSPLGISIAAAPLVLTVLVAIIAGCLKQKEQSGEIVPEEQLSNQRMDRVVIGALSVLALLIFCVLSYPYVVVWLLAQQPNEWKMPYKTTRLNVIYRNLGHPRDCGTADEEVCWRKNHWWGFQELDILCMDCNNSSLLPIL